MDIIKSYNCIGMQFIASCRRRLNGSENAHLQNIYSFGEGTHLARRPRQLFEDDDDDDVDDPVFGHNVDGQEKELMQPVDSIIIIILIMITRLYGPCLYGCFSACLPVLSRPAVAPSQYARSKSIEYKLYIF